MKDLKNYLEEKKIQYNEMKTGSIQFFFNGREFRFSKTGYFRSIANPNEPRGSWKTNNRRDFGPYSHGSVNGERFYLVFRKSPDSRLTGKELVQRLEKSGLLG